MGSTAPMEGVLDGMLSKCQMEPIHLRPAVQDHGALLAVDRSDVVVQASENIGSIIGRAETTAESTLGRSIFDIIEPRDAIAQVLRELRGGEVHAGHTLDVDADEDEMRRNNWWYNRYREEEMDAFLAHCERSAGVSVTTRSILCTQRETGENLSLYAWALEHQGHLLVMIELEQIDLKASSSGLPDMTILNAVSELAACFDQDVAEKALADLVTARAQSTLGFDRVMVYKFDGYGNGTIMSETNAPGLEQASFDGMRFPASDVPKQARMLYQRTRVRSIADVNADPVPLVPALLFGAPVDLSDSSLRACSPVHKQYCRNMGLASTASASIVVDGELWGLISCHHYSSPRALTALRRVQLSTLAAVAQSALANAKSRRRQRILRVVDQASLCLVRDTGSAFERLDTVLREIYGVLEVDTVVAVHYTYGKGTEGLLGNIVGEDGGSEDNDEMIEIDPADLENASLPRDIAISQQVSRQDDSSSSSVGGEGSEGGEGSFMRQELNMPSTLMGTSRKPLRLTVDKIRVYGKPVDTKFLLRVARRMKTKQVKRNKEQRDKVAAGESARNGGEGEMVCESCLAEFAPDLWARRDIEGEESGRLIKPCGVAYTGSLVFDILCVRKETPVNELWGGQLPDQQHDLTPRASFAALNHSVANRCVPWEDAVLTGIAFMFNRLHPAVEHSLLLHSARVAHEFLAQMSHELRTPFSGMISILDMLLLEPSLSLHARNMLHTVNRSAECMLHILDDILTISKMNEGKLELRNRPFMLVRSMKDVVSLHRMRASALRIQLHFDRTIRGLAPNAEEPVLVGDSGRVRQIAMNLVSNALKFTGSGGTVKVSIDIFAKLNDFRACIENTAGKYASATKSPSEICATLAKTIKAMTAPSRPRSTSTNSTGDNGSKTKSSPRRDIKDVLVVLVQVTDSGIGVSQESMSKLFKRFSQIDSGRTKSYQGSGLGLSICTFLARLMGGCVWAASTSADASASAGTSAGASAGAMDAEGSDTSSGGSCFQVALPLWRASPEDTRVFLNSVMLEPPDEATRDASALREAPKGDGGASSSDKEQRKLLTQHLEHEAKERDRDMAAQKNVEALFTPQSIAEIVGDDVEGREREALLRLPSTSEAVEASKALLLRGEKPIVVVADDNEVNRTVFKALCGACFPAAHVVLVETGDAAVRMVNLIRDDCVALVLDLHMPVMEGVEAAKLVRKRFKHLPIRIITADVLFSGSDEVEDIEVLTKPLRKDVLQRSLEAIMERHKERSKKRKLS